jgi:hypothetical protein
VIEQPAVFGMRSNWGWLSGHGALRRSAPHGGGRRTRAPATDRRRRRAARSAARGGTMTRVRGPRGAERTALPLGLPAGRGRSWSGRRAAAYVSAHRLLGRAEARRREEHAFPQPPVVPLGCARPMLTPRWPGVARAGGGAPPARLLHELRASARYVARRRVVGGERLAVAARRRARRLLAIHAGAPARSCISTTPGTRCGVAAFESCDLRTTTWPAELPPLLG